MGFAKEILYRFAGKWLLPIYKSQSIFPYYHLVKNSKVAHIKNLYEYKNVAQFRYDIEFLKENYIPLEPQEIFRQTVRENSFLLTFDDGLAEVYTEIFPILKEKNVKAIFFINPDFVDNKECLYKHQISIAISRLQDMDFPPELLEKIASLLSITYTSNDEFCMRFKELSYKDRTKLSQVLEILKLDIDDYLLQQQPYITKNQIQEMLDSGFYFGGHTMSHPKMNELTVEEQKKEAIDSMEWLKFNFNLNYSCFAFPFSDRGMSKALLNALITYDPNIRIFGNSGLKKDISPNIIQRFSFENPHKQSWKVAVTENLYKNFNQIIRKYSIKRQ